MPPPFCAHEAWGTRAVSDAADLGARPLHDGPSVCGARATRGSVSALAVLGRTIAEQSKMEEPSESVTLRLFVAYSPPPPCAHEA